MKQQNPINSPRPRRNCSSEVTASNVKHCHQLSLSVQVIDEDWIKMETKIKSSPVVSGLELLTQQHISFFLLSQEELMATHIKHCDTSLAVWVLSPVATVPNAPTVFCPVKQMECLCTLNTNKSLRLLNFDKRWTSWLAQTTVSFWKPQNDLCEKKKSVQVHKWKNGVFERKSVLE